MCTTWLYVKLRLVIAETNYITQCTFFCEPRVTGRSGCQLCVSSTTEMYLVPAWDCQISSN